MAISPNGLAQVLRNMVEERPNDRDVCGRFHGLYDIITVEGMEGKPSHNFQELLGHVLAQTKGLKEDTLVQAMYLMSAIESS